MTRPTDATHETHISDHDACTVRRLLAETRKASAALTGDKHTLAAAHDLRFHAVQLCRAVEAAMPCCLSKATHS